MAPFIAATFMAFCLVRFFLVVLFRASLMAFAWAFACISQELMAMGPFPRCIRSLKVFRFLVVLGSLARFAAFSTRVQSTSGIWSGRSIRSCISVVTTRASTLAWCSGSSFRMQYSMRK